MTVQRWQLSNKDNYMKDPIRKTENDWNLNTFETKKNTVNICNKVAHTSIFNINRGFFEKKYYKFLVLNIKH